MGVISAKGLLIATAIVYAIGLYNIVLCVSLFHLYQKLYKKYTDTLKELEICEGIIKELSTTHDGS